MRKQSNNYLSFPFLAVMIIGLIFTSCSDVAGPGSDTFLKSAEIDGDGNYKWSTSFTSTSNGELTNGETSLVYGRNRIKVGTVSFVVQGTNLVLTYKITDEDFPISETNVWVADEDQNLSDVPSSASGPKLGHFPYITQHDDVLFFEEIIDLTKHGFPDAETATDHRIFVVAHAVVGGNETAFAGCYEMLDAGKRWWNALNFWNFGDGTSKERCLDVTSGKRTGGQP